MIFLVKRYCFEIAVSPEWITIDVVLCVLAYLILGTKYHCAYVRIVRTVRTVQNILYSILKYIFHIVKVLLIVMDHGKEGKAPERMSDRL